MKKAFRINVVISYLDGVNVNQYRQPILNILTNFAWLYGLEYAILTDHDFRLEDGTADLIYFRSTERTRISKKDLARIISDVFRNGLSLFSEGVDVGRQMYKVLPQYPFPKQYCRPLNYPYVELHNGNKSTLCILGEALEEISGEDEHKDVKTPVS